MLNRAVLSACKPRHRHQEFLAFLREIDKAVPPELEIHCIGDNYDTDSHSKIKAWLVTRPRWHMHFTPTCSSWLNQGERFLVPHHRQGHPPQLILQRQAVRATHRSLSHAYTVECQPFK